MTEHRNKRGLTVLGQAVTFGDKSAVDILVEACTCASVPKRCSQCCVIAHALSLLHWSLNILAKPTSHCHCVKRERVGAMFSVQYPASRDAMTILQLFTLAPLSEAFTYKAPG